ncbi:MAG: hypothetical protein HPY64_12575 [Anaerolineae bacterium]|nr:hypothetical protein [Anaerolineae bacterium]
MNRELPPLPDFESFEWDAEGPADRDIFSTADTLAAPVSPELMQPAASGRASPASAGATQAPADTPPPVAMKRARRRERLWNVEPVFFYLIMVALSVGLTPLAMSHPVGRYALLWTLLAGGVLASYLLDDGTLEVRLRPRDLMAGAGWGAVVGLPLLLVGAGLLAEISERIFVEMPDGAVFLTIVFVMATTESAFFRGLLQSRQPLLFTVLLASAWSILMFFPTMDVIGYPLVALIAGTFLVMLNVLYGYVRQRNGATAAWVCQTLVSLAWLFVPRLLV